MSTQLSLFTDDQLDILSTAVEEIDKQGAYPVKHSDSWHSGVLEMFCALAAWMCTAPVQTAGPSPSPTAARLRSTDVFIERFLRVKRWIDELKEEEETAKSKAEMQQALARLKDSAKRIQRTLTNPEVCLIFMEVSLGAPLTAEATSEYMRAFARTFGFDTYRKMTDRPIYINDCEMVRYHLPSSISHRMPPLDDDERLWIDNFNQKLKNPANLRLWPGTGATVKVGTDVAYG